MRFKNLVFELQKEPALPIAIKTVISKIVNSATLPIGAVDTIPIKHAIPNGEARFKRIVRATGPLYDTEFDRVEISFCSSLLQDTEAMRLAITQELIHVFADDDQRVASPEKLDLLFAENDSPPFESAASPMYTIELQARFRALLILCPPNFRDAIVSDYASGSADLKELSQKIGVPVYAVEQILSSNYDTARTSFLH